MSDFAKGFWMGAVTAAAWTLILVGMANAATYRAIDGDTISVIETGESIRVIGVDTPEIKHAKCAQEKKAAVEARVFTEKALNSAKLVQIRRQPRPDKYGRTLAVVMIDGYDLADALISRGHGRAYSGGPRQGWC